MTYRQGTALFNGRSPPCAGDRRTEERHLTVYRLARIVRDGDAGLWRVRNMSDRGMHLEADVVVAPDERLDIALSETVTLTGSVKWASAGRCGVQFDSPVRVGELLRHLVAAREEPGYRPLRLPVRCSARLLTGPDEVDITITSISQNGMGFVHDGALQAAGSVLVALADQQWRHGHIRWLDDARAGIRLASPFALKELESVRRLSADQSRQEHGKRRSDEEGSGGVAIIRG